jgi:hypothetical protein
LTARGRIATAALVAVCVFLAWRGWHSTDEQVIRNRLDALTTDINSTVTGGLSTAARAADIAGYFTDGVIVDFGEGAAPIVGRATLVGMASRLERRTAAFRLRFDDVGVRIEPGGTTAAVTLTASFVQRDAADRGDSMDAREFELALEKVSGTWRISRVTAVDTLK